MKASKYILIIIFLFVITNSYAQNTQTTNQDYQQRQKIDLGALTIDGEIVSPGDFSIDDEKAKESKFLFKRKNYNDRLRINIQYVF